MSASLIFRLAIAITRGAVVQTPRWSVGPYREVEDSQRFACLDHRGTPAEAYETWDETIIIRGKPYGDEHFGVDWSAFGAAKVFVLLAGPAVAEAALLRLEDGATVRLPAGEVTCS